MPPVTAGSSSRWPAQPLPPVPTASSWRSTTSRNQRGATPLSSCTCATSRHSPNECWRTPRWRAVRSLARPWMVRPCICSRPPLSMEIPDRSTDLPSRRRHRGERTAVSDVDNSPSPSLPRLEPGSIFAGYRIEALLDRGGMGVVYRATDPDLDREVALKIIAPEHTQNPVAVARFKSEARLAASLEHPNIVPVHRGGEHEGVLHLAMRLVPGTNLPQVLDRGPLALARIAGIVSEVADAVDTAHAAGLVHRDIKPANILLSGQDQSEHAYLADFGLTKRLGSAGDLTRTGGWVGTPDYVAPEQIQGHSVDGRADIYSLGCVVYEMLPGHVAYPKDSHMAKLWAHVTDPPPLPRRDRPELVESFDAVVSRATAKEPNDRFRTAGELAGALRAAVGEQEAKRQFDAAQVTELAAPAKRATTHDEGFAGTPPVAGGAGAPAPAHNGSPPPAAAGGFATGTPQPAAAASASAGSDAAVGAAGSSPPPTTQPRRSRRWLYAAAVLLLLVGAGVAAA